MNRGGTDHDVAAVLITAGSDIVCTFTTSDFRATGPAAAEEVLGGPDDRQGQTAAGPPQEREMCPKDRALKKTKKIIIGGGGNEGDSCRAMAVRWMVEVIAQQWMGLDGLEAARGRPLYFGEGCDQQEVRW